jgi:tetratricopeptide (TPR) repeat protein
MHRLIFLIAIVVLMFSSNDIYAQSAVSGKPSQVAEADAAPRPLTYKSRAELGSEIKRLEALGDLRSWQEDFTLGVAYMHAGRLPEAITLVEKTSLARPSFDKAFESLGMARFRAGDMVGAVRAWERAIKINPKAAHLKKMVTLASDRQEVGNRIDELQEALGTGNGKELWKPRLELAGLYLKLRNADKALLFVKEAISIKGEDAELLEVLGKAQAGRGDYKKASTTFKKAIALTPDSDLPGLRRRRGMLADMVLVIKRVEKAEENKTRKK